MQPKYRMITILTLLIAVLTACGGGGDTATTSSTANSLALSIILNNYLPRGKSASQPFSAISALVQCNNQAPITVTAGTMQLDTPMLINTNSLFQIGSITKSFISVVLLQLADDPQNHFTINDTVGQWFKNIDGSQSYPEWSNITIKQLMTMSSGIPDFARDIDTILLQRLQYPYTYIPPQNLIASVYGMPLLFVPGTGYHYSNTNWILLGLLIEKITGNSPISEVNNRIIHKLNLTHTYFPLNLPAAVVPQNQMVHGYTGNIQLPPPYSSLDGIHDITWATLSPNYTAGAIISTPSDINTYVHALFNPGPLLTTDEITTLTTNLVAIEPSSAAGQEISQVTKSIPVAYGLGIISLYAALPLGNYYEYGGGTLGYGFVYEYFPTADIIVIFTLNTGVSNYSELAHSIVNYAFHICKESTS